MTRTLLKTSSEIDSFQPKIHPLEASTWSVFGSNERISLEGFKRALNGSYCYEKYAVSGLVTVGRCGRSKAEDKRHSNLG